MAQGSKMLYAYTIIEKEGRDNFWLRVGTAWVNQDGSLNVVLDALPVNGRLHIREPREQDDRGGAPSRDNGRGEHREYDRGHRPSTPAQGGRGGAR